MSSLSGVFVGIDWAKEKHDVVIVTESGATADAFTIAHGTAGFEELHRRVARFGAEPAMVHVAIETPHGSVVASCLLKRYTVFTLNPLRLDRFRDRYFPSGAKDDRKDALVLASALRSDPQCFARVTIGSERHCMLEATLKLHDELVEQESVLINRARELLYEYFPQFEKAVGELDSQWCWQAWKLVKSQQGAQRVKEADLAGILKKHRVRRVTAKGLLEQLSAESVPSLPGVVEARSMHLTALVEQIELNQKQQIANEHLLQGLLGVFEQERDASGVSDARLIASMPGAGSYVTAVLLTEAREELAALDYERLRSVSGVAPVTRRSGSKLQVSMRRACRARLRNGVYHFARVAVQQDEDIRVRYAEIRKRGKSHGFALRAVGDGLLRSLIAMLRTRETWKSKTERTTNQQSA